MLHINKQTFSIGRSEREKKNGHGACVVWMSGLSGSGKSTLSNAVCIELFDRNMQFAQLDGDNTRLGLCNDLDFSADARRENLRRAAEVANLNLTNGLITIASFITPTEADRELVRSIIGQELVEIFINAPVELCIERDVKGLYKKALQGEIPSFTGISAPFDVPQKPSLTLNTAEQTITECKNVLVDLILQKCIKND
jgi:adenylyl-sulfate kinase